MGLPLASWSSDPGLWSEPTLIRFILLWCSHRLHLSSASSTPGKSWRIKLPWKNLTLRPSVHATSSSSNSLFTATTSTPTRKRRKAASARRLKSGSSGVASLNCKLSLSYFKLPNLRKVSMMKMTWMTKNSELFWVILFFSLPLFRCLYLVLISCPQFFTYFHVSQLPLSVVCLSHVFIWELGVVFVRYDIDCNSKPRSILLLRMQWAQSPNNS